jgi:hypothetical protein
VPGTYSITKTRFEASPAMGRGTPTAGAAGRPSARCSTAARIFTMACASERKSSSPLGAGQEG